MTEVQERFQPTDSRLPDPRRWKALTVLCLIQFMLTVDVTITNVALPSIKEDLGFTEIGLSWVVNGYVIVAGGLLLLGGRLSDLFGRRKLFLLGVVVFAGASVICGAAQSPGVLVAGRFAQGLGDALAAPAALGLIAVLFTSAEERVKAIGIWGGVAGLAGVTGVVGSGLLTDLASWRWIFYINVPISLVALALLPRLVPEDQRSSTKRLDLPGAVILVAGVLALTFGLTQAAAFSWGSVRVVVPLITGLVLLALLVVVENRTTEPLVPMRFFANRTRAAAYLSGLMFASCFVSFFFLMTLYLQEVQQFSPMRTGISYAPLGISMMVGIAAATVTMKSLGLKRVLAAGFFTAAIGLILGGRLEPDTSYVSGVLPMLILMGIGAGVVMPAGTTAALHGVTQADSGLGSGTHTTVHQVGSAIGVAGLGVLALTHAQNASGNGTAPGLAATNGYAFAFTTGALLLVVAGILVLIFMGRTDSSTDEVSSPEETS